MYKIQCNLTTNESGFHLTESQEIGSNSGLLFRFMSWGLSGEISIAWVEKFLVKQRLSPDIMERKKHEVRRIYI